MSIWRNEYEDEDRPPPLRRVTGDETSAPHEAGEAGEPLGEEAIADRVVTATYHESQPASVFALMVALLAMLEGLLMLRFLLVAFGANRSSGFMGLIHDVSTPFVRPFYGVFRNRRWNQGIIEPATLLAMGMYVLLFLFVTLLVNALLPSVEEREAAFVRRRRYMRS